MLGEKNDSLSGFQFIIPLEGRGETVGTATLLVSRDGMDGMLETISS